MGFLKKAQTKVEATALAKRIALLPDGQFPPHIEQCLYQIGRALYDFEHDRDITHIDEAVMAGEAALELLREFKRRVGAAYSSPSQ